MSRKKNKLFVERMKATKDEDRKEQKIGVRVDVTTKKANQPKKIQDKITVEVDKKQEKHQQQKKQKTEKNFSILTENVFKRRYAQVADQKRKDEYLKAVYKKMEEGHEEDFDR